MGTVLVNDLRTGMCLAEDLYDKRGRFLLSQDTVLQERQIRILKSWGVMHVPIQNNQDEEQEQAPGPSISEWAWRKAGEWIDFSYGPLPDESVDPVLDELTEMATQHIAQQIDQGQFQARLQYLEDKTTVRPSVQSEGFPAPGHFWAKVQKDTSLSTLPDTYFKLQEVIESPRSSASHIAEIVGKDTNLSAKLLKLVNSAFYGFPYRIDTISRAITIIGTNELTSLACGISIIKTFEHVASDLIDMESFWKHAISCGVFARCLSTYKTGISEERMFVAGLLHDIGKMVLLKQVPDHYQQVLEQALRNKWPIQQAEQRLLGLDHTDVGAFLAREWRLPKALQKMIKAHHIPAHDRYSVQSCLLCVANVMADVLAIGTSGNFILQPAPASVWDSLSLTQGTLAHVATIAQRQINEILTIILD